MRIWEPKTHAMPAIRPSQPSKFTGCCSNQEKWYVDLNTELRAATFVQSITGGVEDERLEQWVISLGIESLLQPITFHRFGTFSCPRRSRWFNATLQDRSLRSVHADHTQIYDLAIEPQLQRTLFWAVFRSDNLKPFDGEHVIITLSMYPMRFHEDREGELPLKERLIARGRKFTSLSKSSYCNYQDQTLTSLKRTVSRRSIYESHNNVPAVLVNSSLV